MKNNQYDTIICDFGKVLLHFDHRIAARRLVNYTTKSEEEIYNLFFDSPLTMAYETDELSSEGFLKGVKDALQLDIDKDTFFSIWNNIFFEVPVNLKMQGLIRDVKPFYKLVLLSNINKTHFEF